MELKKGLYFTIDSIIAGSIVLIVILLVSSFYVKHTSIEHLSFLSQDIIDVLSTITINDVKNKYTYINERITAGDIDNMDNTVLQQIAEFWADSQLDFANKTASNVTELWLPNSIGYGIWIDNEPIYNRDIPIKKSLISSKKMVSGIRKGPSSSNTRQNPPTLWGPAIFEVRAWE